MDIWWVRTTTRPRLCAGVIEASLRTDTDTYGSRHGGNAAGAVSVGEGLAQAAGHISMSHIVSNTPYSILFTRSIILGFEAGGNAVEFNVRITSLISPSKRQRSRKSG